ncbi:UNVERIFIED_CONTAM: ribulose-phosphate 3-epimerase [Murimonas intestini]|uniref:Ribulose-phosphate 3-epimerase n=2 Tax=Murimonas intestini TaxID=1337051 RepID=A0AB73SZ00_9FIRM
MMCADLLHLKKDIELFEKNKIEYLHIDVMDGNFVPNFGLGVDYIRGLRGLTSTPLDLHLMVNKPEEKYEWLGIQPTDQVCIHYESTVHIQRALEKLKKYQCRIMLAINPGTPIYSVEEVLEYIDGVTILTVNPGFAGQPIVKSCIKKVEKMYKFLLGEGYENLSIEVDGNISFENAKKLRGLGADIFVAGSSSIFGKTIVMEDSIKRFREAIKP